MSKQLIIINYWFQNFLKNKTSFLINLVLLKMILILNLNSLRVKTEIMMNYLDGRIFKKNLKCLIVLKKFIIKRQKYGKMK